MKEIGRFVGELTDRLFQAGKVNLKRIGLFGDQDLASRY